MPDKVNITQIIIESSIVFISIFTTLSLLFSAASSEFKVIYYYLGYMLYYSLPFILACFFGIISIVIENNDAKLSELIEKIQIAFFLTGLMLLLLLATTATSSILLPLNYTAGYSYIQVIMLEFITFIILFIGLVFPVASDKSINVQSKPLDYLLTKIIQFRNKVLRPSTIKYLQRKKTKNYFKASIAITLIFIFVGGIIFMSLIGFVPTRNAIQSGSASLQFTISDPLNLTACFVANASFNVVDSAEIHVTSLNGGYFYYYFLDEQNYYIQSNPKSSDLTPVYINSGFGKDIIVNAVVNQTGTYYLIFRGVSAEGTMVNYSIAVTKIDTFNQGICFIVSSVSIGFFIVTIRTIKPKKQATISSIKNT